MQQPGPLRTTNPVGTVQNLYGWHSVKYDWRLNFELILEPITKMHALYNLELSGLLLSLLLNAPLKNELISVVGQLLYILN